MLTCRGAMSLLLRHVVGQVSSCISSLSFTQLRMCSSKAKGFSFLALCFSAGLFVGPILGGELLSCGGAISAQASVVDDSFFACEKATWLIWFMNSSRFLLLMIPSFLVEGFRRYGGDCVRLVFPAERFPQIFGGTIFETYPFLLPNLTYASWTCNRVGPPPDLTKRIAKKVGTQPELEVHGPIIVLDRGRTSFFRCRAEAYDQLHSPVCVGDLYHY